MALTMREVLTLVGFTVDRARSGGIRNIVLVHGGFADGSGWEGVHRLLAPKGYKITVVQQPASSLAEDVGYVTRAIVAPDGPVVLIGHSYGDVIITEAGRDPTPDGAAAQLSRRTSSCRMSR